MEEYPAKVQANCNTYKSPEEPPKMPYSVKKARHKKMYNMKPSKKTVSDWNWVGTGEGDKGQLRTSRMTEGDRRAPAPLAINIS